MKILIVSPTFPVPANDGGKIVIKNTFDDLISAGLDVDFICISKERIKQTLISGFHPSRTPEVFYDEKITSKVRILRALKNNNSYLISKFYSREFENRIRDKIRQKKYDIIHFEGLHSAEYALNLKNEISSKIVLRLHNIESVILKRFSINSKNSVMKKFFDYEFKRMRRLEQRVYSEIKNVIFISDDDKETSGISNWKDDKSLVLTAGVDTQYFSNVDDNTSNNLIYLGSMDWKPNENAVIWFIENIFNSIAAAVPDLKFYVVGKNPSEKMKKYSSDKIIVTGTVEDVREYINKAGIAVIPLLIGGGMRIKILEMMAAGRPVISTSIGAEGIQYNDGKNILIADDPVVFREAVFSLLHNPKLKTEIIEQAKELINERYTWKSVTEKLINYYNQI